MEPVMELSRCMFVGWLLGLATLAVPFATLLVIHLRLRKTVARRGDSA